MRSLGVTLTLLASIAAAQGAQPEAAVSRAVDAPDAPPPPPAPLLEEQAPGPAVAPAFVENVLSWNPKTNTASVGLQHVPLPRDAFYALLGRPELSVESDRARTRRVWLFVGAGAVLAAGAITAAAMWSSLPNLNAGYCPASFANYNGPLCVEQYKTRMAIAPGALIAGIAGAALLSGFAVWSSPDVLTGDAAQSAVARYNAGLKQRVARSEGATLQLAPLVSPFGGGLLASGRF
jgi:hypothetical protein